MDKTKFYLNLSKCTEEEQKSLPHVFQKYRQKYTPVIKENLLPTDIIHFHKDWDCWALSVGIPPLKTELTYPEFIKLFEGGESKEVLQVENNEWIKSIAISHQKQMSSTHPHAIIGTIEDAIIEALETFKSNQ